ncbi:MAG: hypothetical protein EP329_01255 [Deltaproteobacteria bacterium]|nr:MAG: hypothetical protein EP329_01255 [Deltaproteobacteria bacterium]
MTSLLARGASTTLALAVAFASGCAQAPPSGPESAGRLDVNISALTLSGVSNANYTLEVLNEDGETVFSITLDSAQYGAGASASYVGTCDASDPNLDGHAENTVQLTVNGLDDTGGTPIPVDRWQNPTATGPLERVVDCVENTDVPVTFDIAILRAANQGFFDIAVDFDDLFCSAKADCEYAPGQPITLLHDASGARAQTLVMGFACTGGADSDTHLYWQSVAITCDGQSYDLAAAMSANARGNQGALGGLVFQHAYYFGHEQLGTYDKLYFDLAIGLDVAELGVNGHTACTLDAVATMSDGPLTGGETPAGSAWPIVTWTIPINVGSATTLACTRHPLNGGNGLATSYTPLAAPEAMRFEVDNDAGTVSVTDLSPPALPGAPIAGPWITPEVTLDRLQIFSADTLQLVWSRDAAQQATPAAHVVLLDAGGTIIAYASSAAAGSGGTATFGLCAGGSQTAAVGDVFTVGVIADAEFNSDCAVMNASATVLRQQPMLVSGTGMVGDYVTISSATIQASFADRVDLVFSQTSAQANFGTQPDLHLAFVAPDGTVLSFTNILLTGGTARSGTMQQFFNCPGSVNPVAGSAYALVGVDAAAIPASPIADICQGIADATEYFRMGIIVQ